MADARFLLRPRWLLSHLFVVLLVVVMVNLGFWQLRRLDEKRQHNDLIESRTDQPEVAVGDLLDPGDGKAAVDAVRFRRVIAAGTYDARGTIDVRNRSLDGAPGAWLVTPVTLDGGERVAVIRGFVGFRSDGSFEPADVPEGRVTVTGLVMDPDRLGGSAGRDLRPLIAEDGTLPAVILADGSRPPEPGGLDGPHPERATILPVPPPVLDEGPHLSYAVQWFIFSTIAVVGYPLVLRNVVARRGKEASDAEAGVVAEATTDLDRELEDLLRDDH